MARQERCDPLVQTLQCMSIPKPMVCCSCSSLHQTTIGAPLERVAFDILSIPVETAEGNTCLLVICDYFTKWVEAFPLPDHRAITVADVLVTEVFLCFGVPRYLHSDQAPEFMSELMGELCESWRFNVLGKLLTDLSLTVSSRGLTGL